MKRRYFAMTLLLLAFGSFHFFKPKAELVTRAAVDVGSGGLKVTVAKIDPTSQKIDKILYSKEHSVLLKRDLQVGGKSEFSDKIQKVALETIANLQRDIAPLNPKEWRGIATAASRQAKNAQAMYDKIADELGVVISIISQQEEGRLGFMTAASVSKVDQNNLIAFDSGSGSFQLTTLIDDKLEVVEGDLGHIPSLELLMQLRGTKLDHQTPPDPVTHSEAKALIPLLQQKLPPMPTTFAEN